MNRKFPQSCSANRFDLFQGEAYQHATQLVFIVVLIVVLGGCGFNIGVTRSSSKRDFRPTDSAPLAQSRLWIRYFAHEDLAAWGQRIIAPSPAIIQAFNRTGAFKFVMPNVKPGETFDYVLDGSVTAEWEWPWWSRIQLVDFYIHAYFFPTLGKTLVGTVKIVLRNSNFKLVKVWNINYESTYMGPIWWAMWHPPGAFRDLEAKFENEAIEFAAETVKRDLQGTPLARY